MATAGRKDDQEKPDMDLLSPYALEKIAQVMTFGKKKYGANNWRGGIVYSRLLAAVLRHINSYRKGETFDPETGFSHLSHASCGLMMLLEFEETRPDLDDRVLKEEELKLDPQLVHAMNAIDLHKAAEDAQAEIEKMVKDNKKNIFNSNKKFVRGDIIKHINNDTEVTVEETYFDDKGNPVLFVRDSEGKIFGVDQNYYKSIYVPSKYLEKELK
jgi:hypothetical protein